MDLSAFLMENALPPEEREVVISNRFLQDGEPVKFRLRSISEGENLRLKKSCRLKTPDRPDGILDRDRYLLKLAAAAVVSPDLKDASLQQSWGVMGEEELLLKMLSAGEFAALLAEVKAVCGFEHRPELKETLKKSSAGETAN